MVLRFSMLAVVFLLSCTDFERSNPFDENNPRYGEWESENREQVEFEFTDSRDKKVYDAVEYTITKRFYKRDGELIKEELIDKISWMEQNLSYKASGSVCYDNDESNCTNHGRLYDYETAKTACPSGWRLPKSEEAEEFYLVAKLLGYESCYKMEFDSTAGIYNCKNRWSGLGGIGYSNDNFSDLDSAGHWWTGTEYKADKFYSIFGQMSKSGSSDIKKSLNDKGFYLSVRCVTNSEVASSSNSKPSSSSYNRASVVNGPSVTYGGGTYETVVIGFQTWMARDLNYQYVNGNKCRDNCSSRFYNWAAAMNLPSTCNTSSCASQVNAIHQGICPPGWHIPSDADWETLFKVGGGVTHLGASWGWSKDTYGFSALSGGYCYTSYYGELYCTDSNNGFWWTSDETNDKSAHFRYLGTSSISENSKGKEDFMGVRCIKDDPSLVKPSSSSVAFSSSSRQSSSSAMVFSSSSKQSEEFCVVYDDYDEDVYCITNIESEECELYFNDDGYEEDYAVFQDYCPKGGIIKDWNDY